MAKLWSYILIILGLAALALSLKIIPITLPESINLTYVMIAGIALLIIGFFFALSKKKHASGEVPIYHGNKIVGYRREK